MKKLLLAISVLLLSASATCAATKDISVEYSHEDIADVHHATVYMDGLSICSSSNNSTMFDCSAVTMRPGSHSFTLTVSDASGGESAPSLPIVSYVKLGRPVILKFEMR